MSKPDLGRIIAQTMARPAEGRTIEAITGEILDAKRAGGEAILTIGRCLIEAKDMLPHGEWKDWLADRVEFSERAAQRFMRLAREWSNPTALSDLGATKALTLLALPAEEREQFMEDHDVIDMTTRQLEQAIKERDEARKAAEAAKAEASTAEQGRAKMADDMAMTKASLRAVLEEKQRTVQDVDRLQQELAELKKRPVEVAVETVADPEALEKARAEAVAEMQAKLDRAKERQKKAEAQAKEAQDALERTQAQLQDSERARKNAVLASDEDMATFQVLFQQAQEQANKMRGILLKLRGRADQTAAQGGGEGLAGLVRGHWEVRGMSVWYDQAKVRLESECKTIKGQKERAMGSAVRDALLEFCRQNEEFAQAVVQGGTFQDCMAAVAKGVGGSISDLEAYRRAVCFYFDGAKVKFQMVIELEPAQTEPDRGGLLLNLSDFF